MNIKGLLQSEIKIGLKITALMIMIAVYVFGFSSSLVYAGLSPQQQLIFNAGIKYFDHDESANCTTQTTTNYNSGVFNIPTEWGVRGKLAQMLMVSVSTEAEAKELIAEHVGGVYLGRQFTTADKPLLDKFYSSSVVPPIIASDEEGGKVQRIRGIKTMPSAKVMGGWTEDKITKTTQEQAAALKSIGVRMAFAPVADLDGGSSVISGNDRAFSADPKVVATKAGAFAAGYRNTGVIPVFKHFPGHGHADGDSHVKAVTTPPLATMKQQDLKPYETLLKSGDSAVMMGHMDVPGLTKNGMPSSLSPDAYNLLRKDYGFQGVITTDDIGSMVAISSKYGTPTAASMAIQAGADMAGFVNGGKVKAVLDRLVADHDSGKITDARIDESLARIGKLRTVFGLSSPSVSNPGSTNFTTPAPQGQDNREITYNFFISKGLSPVIAAGFVGNFMMESGVNPLSVSKNGATGIAQWLGGRRANLKKRPDWQTIMGQLEFVWQELNGGENAAYKQILTATSLESATTIISQKFERPGTTATDAKRIKFARDAFNQFGNGTGALPTTPADSNYCVQAVQSTAPGGGGGTEYVDGFTFYMQGQEPWASHPYGTSTIRKSGCGPSATAMVITALTKTKVTPIDVADLGTKNNTYSPGNGSYHSLFFIAAKNWGLKAKSISASQVATTIQNGGMVIVSGGGLLPFSKDGHIISIRAIDKDGKLLLGNSAFPQTNKRSWTIEEIDYAGSRRPNRPTIYYAITK